MELAKRVKDRIGSASEIVVVPYDEAYGEGFEDMERRQPDIDKIRGLLGWEPENTIDQIIDDVVAYYEVLAAG
jgi:UDP-glucose 4-epimerase